MNQLIITGGHGGLATAIAETFESDGWAVIPAGRFDLDVADPASIRPFFKERQVDLLICAAGIIRDAPLSRLSEDAWDEVMAVNFHGASGCARAVLPGMLARGGGHIVFISSHSALHPPVGQTAYAASKAALHGLATDLARDVGPHNIRVNTILPGFLETPMTRSVTPTRRQQILDDHVLGRFNTPADVARFIHFLHHQLPHTSGQIFQLDSRTGL